MVTYNNHIMALRCRVGSRPQHQKQGYPKVKDYDVDSKKAETLDGRFCSKNKCKVFDSIACEM